MAAPPHPVAILDDLISGFGMMSSKMATDSLRAAILRHRHNGGRKTLPKSWLTSFPAPPSWMVSSKMAAPQITSGGRWNFREDIIQTSVPSSERGCSSKKTPCRRLTLFFYFSIEIVSLPQPFAKWLRELPACHYGVVDQAAHVKTTFHETWCWLRQAPILLFFFKFLTVLFNIRKLL